MTKPDNRPLVTFFVAAYNQERFIREAVEAAFAQTYSPLEIILSDDCSEDRTFEIMRELAAAYHGPHQIVLNRNPVRRSIGGHGNRLMELTRGELIVGAAGDDVSLPQRTQVIYDAWERLGRPATSIHSDFIQIDKDGRTIEKILKNEGHTHAGHLIEQQVQPLTFVQTLKPVVFGCTHAHSPKLSKIFGKMPEHIIHEDDIWGFRSILAGRRLLYINEPLVKYRLHGNNVYVRSGERGANLNSIEEQENRFRRDLRNRETMYETFLLDLEQAGQQGIFGGANLDKTVEEAKRMRRKFSLMGEFLESGFFRKCRILSNLRREGVNGKELKILIRRLIPRFLFLRIRLARSYAASLQSRVISQKID